MEDKLEVIAPGKVILHGEHAVVYGKRAIAVSVGLFTKLTIKPSMEAVHVKFSEVGIDVKLPTEDLKNLKEKLGSSFRFEELNEFREIPISDEVKKILDTYCETSVHFDENSEESLKPAQNAAFQSFLFLYLGIFDEIQPYSFHIQTELPVGAGLGSSASFGVALAGGILLAAKREKISGYNVDTINRWAFVSEKFVHGSPSGVDNSVATFGGGIIFKKGAPLEHIVGCPDIHVLLVNTKIPRSTKVLVAKVAKLKETDPTVFEKCMDEMDSIVGECVTEIQDRKVVSEELISRNQKILSKIGVSHPSLDLIVKLAKDHGLSAKLTGAGGGGCAFIYIPSGRTQESIQPLLNTLRENEFQVWDTVLGCKGFSVCENK